MIVLGIKDFLISFLSFISAVMAAASIANIVKSSLGPVGLDKMLVDDIGVSISKYRVSRFKGKKRFVNTLLCKFFVFIRMLVLKGIPKVNVS